MPHEAQLLQQPTTTQSLQIGLVDDDTKGSRIRRYVSFTALAVSAAVDIFPASRSTRLDWGKRGERVEWVKKSCQTFQRLTVLTPVIHP